MDEIAVNYAKKRICVIGLGRLGSSFYACWHKKGFQAVGIDKNPDILKAISNKNAPVPEPGLQEVLDTTHAGMYVRDGDSIPKAVRESDVIFILVNTPARPDGTFNSDAIEDVAYWVAYGLVSRDDYPVVVVASTVSPTAIEECIIPALEQRIEKDRKGQIECGKDFGVCYIPEWVALGELMHGFLNPELCLIGASDEKAGDIMEEVYHEFLDNDPPFIRTNLVNAEIAKVSLNAYVATKITFANIIADVCEKTPGADASVVTSAIGLDSRIGRKYFRGGLPYGGACFSRDVPAMRALVESVDSFSLLPVAVHQNNKDRLLRLARLVVSTHKSKAGSVGIVGLAFKPNTDVVENSPSIWLIDELKYYCLPISVHDPLVGTVTVGKSNYVSTSLESLCAQSNTIVIMNALDEIKKIPPYLFKNKTIIDCWGVLENSEHQRSAQQYIKLGKYITK